MASEIKYDGKYVLRTNTKLTNREVAQSYKLLWKVERAFRELKIESALQFPEGPLYFPQ